MTKTREIFSSDMNKFVPLGSYFAVWKDIKFAYGKPHFFTSSGVFDCDDKPVQQYAFQYALFAGLNLGSFVQANIQVELIQHANRCELSIGHNSESVTYEDGYVTFYSDYYEDGDKPIGRVRLNQFKTALEAYIQFLSDPERKPVVMVYPME